MIDAYKRFEVRLQSFSNTSNEWLSKKSVELAEAGFYYTGNANEIKCFCCELVLNQWEKDDIPLNLQKCSKCLYILTLIDLKKCCNEPYDIAFVEFCFWFQRKLK